jgi:Arylsulfotransferase (ASST)
MSEASSSTRLLRARQLLLFDNGDQRVLDSSGTIYPNTTPCTSRVAIFQVDETEKIATTEWVDYLAPVFSSFAGSARLMPNGHIQFAESQNGTIYEVTKSSPPQAIGRCSLHTDPSSDLEQQRLSSGAFWDI